MTNTKQRQDSLTLEMLEAIEDQSDVTQRTLARRMDVALGLTNSYLKRCVRKGWVKIHQAPANRYLYYLTPKGFAEKSRLTAQYLSVSFSFYRKASDSCARVMSNCAAQEAHRLILCGTSDLAEIALLRATEYGLNIVAIYDDDSDLPNFLNYGILKELDDAPDYDRCVVTSLSEPRSLWLYLCHKIGYQKVVAPDILGLEKITG